jgi:hypothetical protein
MRRSLTVLALVAYAVRGAPAAADCELRTQTLPIPIWATLPNEGETWGFMPVFLRVCPEDERTESIIAPSLSWNSVIHTTGTFRWFHYPTGDTTVIVVGSVSTQTNRNGLLAWQHLPGAVGAVTEEVTLRLQRDVFYRFFGLGPNTAVEAESSYTRVRALASARVGLNVAPHLNLGVAAWIEADDVQDIGIPGLPLTRTAFPGVPGMSGSSVASQALELRYDDRRGGDYAERGLRIDASTGVAEGIARSPGYLRGSFEARGVWTELDGLSGAARASWAGVSSGMVPFYLQSALGGSLVLRGFMPDRFIDQQAWTVEVEQRVRLFRTHLFGVTADWRVDPFLSAGQVFARFDDALSRPRAAGGLGLRAFVHPNVLGRIDVAKGFGEHLSVYVELGYPY